MTILMWLRLALAFWEMIAEKSRNTWDEKIASELRAALDRYEQEHGKELTHAQFEQFRYVPKW